MDTIYIIEDELDNEDNIIPDKNDSLMEIPNVSYNFCDNIIYFIMILKTNNNKFLVIY